MDTNLYLWTKVLHIVMVTSWFAGLFYLPRIYVNLAQVDPDIIAKYLPAQAAATAPKAAPAAKKGGAIMMAPAAKK